MPTVGSSFDQKLCNEIEAIINGYDSMNVPAKVTLKNIPEEIDDTLLGQEVKTAEEANYQRGQEVALTISSLGWKYIVESLRKMVQKYESEFRCAATDAEVLSAARRWRIAEEIVNDIIRTAEAAASVPSPEEFPQ